MGERMKTLKYKLDSDNPSIRISCEIDLPDEAHSFALDNKLMYTPEEFESVRSDLVGLIDDYATLRRDNNHLVDDISLLKGMLANYKSPTEATLIECVRWYADKSFWDKAPGADNATVINLAVFDGWYKAETTLTKLGISPNDRMAK
jgi:hypothetical protein